MRLTHFDPEQGACRKFSIIARVPVPFNCLLRSAYEGRALLLRRFQHLRLDALS